VCVAAVLGEMDSAALAEIRSYPRAPRATWRVIKACLYLTGAPLWALRLEDSMPQP